MNFDKKQKRSQKGFTLVELLVVIAIIGILATVSVVGYTTYINNARESNDNFVIDEMNEHLNAAYKVENDGDIEYPSQVASVLKEHDYDISSVTPTVKNVYYAYDSETKSFLSVDGEGNVHYKGNETHSKLGTNIFVFVTDEESRAAFEETGYSAYLQSSYAVSGTIALGGVGLDVGEVEGVSSITYSNLSSESGNSAQEIVIYTNSLTTELNVNAYKTDSACDTIHHYGDCGVININTNGNKSFHEWGDPGIINLTEGRLVIESGSYVYGVNIALNDSGAYSNPVIAVSQGASMHLLTRESIEGESFSTEKEVELCQIDDSNTSADAYQIWLGAVSGSTAATTDAASVSSSMATAIENLSQPTNLNGVYTIFSVLFNQDNLDVINDSMIVPGYYHNADAVVPFLNCNSFSDGYFDPNSATSAIKAAYSNEGVTISENNIEISDDKATYVRILNMQGTRYAPASIKVNGTEYEAYRFGRIVLDSYAPNHSEEYTYSEQNVTLPIIDARVDVDGSLLETDNTALLDCGFAAFSGILTTLDCIATYGDFDKTNDANVLKDNYSFDLITMGADLMTWCSDIQGALNGAGIDDGLLTASGVTGTMQNLLNCIIKYQTTSDGSTAVEQMETAMGEGKTLFAFSVLATMLTSNPSIVTPFISNLLTSFEESLTEESLTSAICSANSEMTEDTAKAMAACMLARIDMEKIETLSETDEIPLAALMSDSSAASAMLTGGGIVDLLDRASLLATLSDVAKNTHLGVRFTFAKI